MRHSWEVTVKRKTWRRLVVMGAILCIVGTALAAVVWLPRDQETKERVHQHAIEHWLDLVQNDFNAQPEEVIRTFGECFQAGDSADRYDPMFSTATKNWCGFREPERINWFCYTWRWKREPAPGGDISFDVVVGGQPRVIQHASWGYQSR
jgi:hypothetical protein